MEHSKALWDWKLKDNADGRSSITASVAGGATARSSITFHATSSMRHSHHLIQRSMVPLVRSFYDLSALQWDRRELNFSRFKGKVVLITNTATAHPQSNSQFIQVRKKMPMIRCNYTWEMKGKFHYCSLRIKWYSTHTKWLLLIFLAMLQRRGSTKQFSVNTGLKVAPFYRQ